MTYRGRVLRDTSIGPGLLNVDGKQVSFTLEDKWQSEIPPRTGMVVDVVINSQGVVESVRAVSENQIAKEQAQQALAGARQQSTVIAGNLKARFGLPMLIAIAALLVGWFFLNSMSIVEAHVDLTFWQILGPVGNVEAFMRTLSGDAASGSGVFKLLAIAALVGPFLSYFWKDRRASLAGMLPMLLMILVSVLIWHNANHAIDQMVGHPMANNPALEKARQIAMENFMKQFEIGVGAYLSFAAGAYLGFIGVRKYLVSNP
jgi:hypothetical protein